MRPDTSHLPANLPTSMSLVPASSSIEEGAALPVLLPLVRMLHNMPRLLDVFKKILAQLGQVQNQKMKNTSKPGLLGAAPSASMLMSVNLQNALLSVYLCMQIQFSQPSLVSSPVTQNLVSTFLQAHHQQNGAGVKPSLLGSPSIAQANSMLQTLLSQTETNNHLHNVLLSTELPHIPFQLLSHIPSLLQFVEQSMESKSGLLGKHPGSRDCRKSPKTLSLDSLFALYLESQLNLLLDSQENIQDVSPASNPEPELKDHTSNNFSLLGAYSAQPHKFTSRYRHSRSPSECESSSLSPIDLEPWQSVSPTDFDSSGYASSLSTPILEYPKQYGIKPLSVLDSPQLNRKKPLLEEPRLFKIPELVRGNKRKHEIGDKVTTLLADPPSPTSPYTSPRGRFPLLPFPGRMSTEYFPKLLSPPRIPRLLPSPESSPDGQYVGQHSQGIGGHYADSYMKKRPRWF